MTEIPQVEPFYSSSFLLSNAPDSMFLKEFMWTVNVTFKSVDIPLNFKNNTEKMPNVPRLNQKPKNFRAASSVYRMPLSNLNQF